MNEIFRFRLSSEERKKWEEQARSVGRSLSSYIRYTMNGGSFIQSPTFAVNQSSANASYTASPELTSSSSNTVGQVNPETVFANTTEIRSRPAGSLWNVPYQDWEWEERFAESEGRHSTGAGELGQFIARHRGGK